MSTNPTPTTPPAPRLRWYQFSLRTLLLFVTLCALPCSWVGVKMQRVREQREAAAAIERMGGTVSYSARSGPPWLQSVLAYDMLRSIEAVELSGPQVTDAALENLKELKRLRGLSLNETQITDAGLEHITGLSQLLELSLCGVPITDAGLEHLKRLTHLRGLRLGGTQVTDAGLKSLNGLSRLDYLYLNDTQVTSAGVAKLQQALPNCSICR